MAASCEDLERENQSVLFHFWVLLLSTALIASSLSFFIDGFTFFLRRLHLSWALPLDVALALAARLVAKTCVEAEGSGYPEMKAMLFGKVLFNYLSLRVLLCKAVALTLGVASGLPLGKDGPNVHIAACIAHALSPGYFHHLPQGHCGGSGARGAVPKLLLAACSVGLGATFSAPIGGVIFALELMLPQSYDALAYWGCFTASVVGAITYSAELTISANSCELLPLISSNVLPHEGAGEYPILRLLLDVVLGALCGLAAGAWVSCHSYVSGCFKRWRSTRRGTQQSVARFCDLFLVAAVTVMNNRMGYWLPLLAEPQPVLISTIFDKTLLDGPVLPEAVPAATASGKWALCLTFKWFTTVAALSLALPAGVVAPSLVIGGLLGRLFAQLLPDSLVEFLLYTGTPVTDLQRGAFLARLAMVGAGAFSAAVCRALALAVVVFETLALPNSVLPLICSALTAIFVANRVALSFFDASLWPSLSSIPAITYSYKSLVPAVKVMRVLRPIECLPQMATRSKLLQALATGRRYFPVLRYSNGAASSASVGFLRGTVSRENLLRVLELEDGPDSEWDLLASRFVAPENGEPLVETCPTCVTPCSTVKDVFLLLKLVDSDVIYVADRGQLLGAITLETILSVRL
ncbi:unnamed protein product [Effrenium voratum]|nr:unnamed protein product [Effrenium voratum]